MQETQHMVAGNTTGSDNGGMTVGNTTKVEKGIDCRKHKS